MPERLSPEDPREWLNRAKSSLARARLGAEDPDVYLEDLCFDAQQAAEKAIKAVLLRLNVRFPYVHDLAALLTLAEQAGATVPEKVRLATGLTAYAVATRCPGPFEGIMVEDHEEAVRQAEAVFDWAQGIVDPVCEPEQAISSPDAGCATECSQTHSA